MASIPSPSAAAPSESENIDSLPKHEPKKRTHKLVKATEEQTALLIAAYAQGRNIQGAKLSLLSQETGLSTKWIASWFMRKRAKEPGYTPKPRVKKTDVSTAVMSETATEDTARELLGNDAKDASSTAKDVLQLDRRDYYRPDTFHGRVQPSISQASIDHALDSFSCSGSLPAVDAMNQDEVVQFKTEYQDQALSFSAPSVDHGIIDLATIPHSTSHAQSPSSAHAEHVHFSPDGQLQSGAGTSTPFTPSRGLQNNKLGFSSIHPIVSSSISPLSAKTPCYPKISPLMLEGRGKENIPPYPMLDLQYPPLRNIRPQPSNQSSDAELFPRLSAHLNAFSGGHNMNVDMVSRSGPNSLSSILASISSDSTLVSSASSASPFNTTSALTICDYASSSGLLPPSSKEPPAYPNDSDMLPPSSAPSSPTSEYRNIGIITRRPAPNVLDESEEIPTSSPPTSVFDEWIPTEPATSSSAEPPRLGFSSTMKLKARNLLARTSTEINMLDSGSLPSPSDPAEGGDGMPTHSSSLPPGYHAVMNLTGREYHSPSFAVEPPSPEQPACIPSPPSGMPAYMRRKLSLGGVQRLVDPKLMEDPFEAAMSLVYLSTIGLEWDSGSGS